jgi:hypothetical protein
MTGLIRMIDCFDGNGAVVEKDAFCPIGIF